MKYLLIVIATVLMFTCERHWGNPFERGKLRGKLRARSVGVGMVRLDWADYGGYEDFAGYRVYRRKGGETIDRAISGTCQ